MLVGITTLLLSCLEIKFKETTVCSVIQSYPTCDPMDYSPPGSSVHGIFQPRILEWVAISFSQILFSGNSDSEVPHSLLSHWIYVLMYFLDKL